MIEPKQGEAIIEVEQLVKAKKDGVTQQYQHPIHFKFMRVIPLDQDMKVYAENTANRMKDFISTYMEKQASDTEFNEKYVLMGSPGTSERPVSTTTDNRNADRGQGTRSYGPVSDPGKDEGGEPMSDPQFNLLTAYIDVTKWPYKEMGKEKYDLVTKRNEMLAEYQHKNEIPSINNITKKQATYIIDKLKEVNVP